MKALNKILLKKENLSNKFIKISLFLFFIYLFFFIPYVLSQESAYGSEIRKSTYVISRSIVDRSIKEGNMLSDYFEVSNMDNRPITFTLSVDDTLSNFIEFNNLKETVSADNSSKVFFLVKGKEIGNFSGNIKFKGDIEEIIPVRLIVEADKPSTSLLLEVNLLNNIFLINKFIEFKIDVNKLGAQGIENATFSYNLIDEKNFTYSLGKEERGVNNSYQDLKKIYLPKNLSEGFYKLEVSLNYSNSSLVNTSPFHLKRSFFNILIFNIIPMWALFVFLFMILVGILITYLILRNIKKKKKYQMRLDPKTIPKKNSDFLFLGKIAESNLWGYLEPNRLTTHTIVAGATGGGKSIAAQVIIEEALMHNIAVIVFDPTAQWSGMLRKCEDKKMLSFYSKFGLKESDARGFKGNVRQVKNSRELIEINKYINPGQIQIFSLNKLDPSEMDIFVANVIRQVFRSDPKESPDLKVLIVFDEVHRLLAKFGGSGEGFLQVERACREFRKWGIGVMLISQVLSDFVGEIKANINTEVQMRTRDEGDLNRIQMKYGEDSLRSLVKSSIGTGMFVNTAYNHSNPYFISFRPILHNTRRLSDEELDKYNKFNDIVDDLEFQIIGLESEKVDVFDLKMELKLVKDKLMTGSFSVVEIYLEGLGPRVVKEWSRIGKVPVKREVKLVDESEIKKSIEEAKKAREKFEAEEAKKQKAEKKEKEVSPEDELKALEEKEVNPLTFDNGIMVSSLKELKGVLPTIDKEIFKTHVNENKNDISEWIGKNISKELGDKLKTIIIRKEMVNEIENFGKIQKKEDLKNPEQKT